MNCKNCQGPLDPQARFCPRCGVTATVEENTVVRGGVTVTVEENTVVREVDHNTQATSIGSWPVGAEATLVTPQQSMPSATNPQPLSQQSQQAEQAQWPRSDSYLQPEGPIPYAQQQAWSYPPQDQQSSFPQNVPSVPYDPRQMAMGSQMPAAIGVQLQKDTRAARRGLGGCFFRLFIVLVLLLAVLVGVWSLALRPYIHGIAEHELNSAMTQAVDRLQPFPSLALLLLYPSKKIPIGEGDLERQIKSRIAPAGSVQAPVVHINQQGVRLEFIIHQNFLSFDFNFPSAISLVPALDANDHIVASNVNVEGIASLVMSSDEMANLLNQHLSDLMKWLNHPVSKINLQQGDMEVILK